MMQLAKIVGNLPKRVKTTSQIDSRLG